MISNKNSVANTFRLPQNNLYIDKLNGSNKCKAIKKQSATKIEITAMKNIWKPKSEATIDEQ